jgi:hypothetical protein
MMIDGMRYPQQGNGLLPDRPLDHSRVRDRTLSTCCSTARRQPTVRTPIGGVINIILKRNFDGAMVEAGSKLGKGGQHPISRVGHVGPDLGRRPGDAELFLVRHRAPRTGISTRSSPSTTRRGGFDDRRPIGSSMRAPSRRETRSAFRCPILLTTRLRTRGYRRQFPTRTIRATSGTTARTATPFH